MTTPSALATRMLQLANCEANELAEVMEQSAAALLELQSKCDALAAELERVKGQEPVGEVRAKRDAYGGTFVLWKKLPVAGMLLYAAPTPPAQPDMHDAYVGAREDLEIWERRALEAEELNRKFVAEINGPTFMGEPPAQPAHEQSSAERTLHMLGYTDCGGELWKPPLGRLTHSDSQRKETWVYGSEKKWTNAAKPVDGSENKP